LRGVKFTNNKSNGVCFSAKCKTHCSSKNAIKINRTKGKTLRREREEADKN
jgi:hypothetical protein